MTTPQQPKVPRAMVRLDEDIHGQLRETAFYTKNSITRLANDLLRNAIQFAQAGVFDRPINPTELKHALDIIAKEKQR